MPAGSRRRASRGTTGSLASSSGASQRDCVIFVTHRWSAAIAGHYERLKREAGPVLDVYLVYQPTTDDDPGLGEANADVVLRREDITGAFPARTTAQADWLFSCTDLIWLVAARTAPVAQYDRVWAIEYDVDYSGDWAEFFGPAAGYDGDLLGIELRRRSADPRWGNVRDYAGPENGPRDPLIGFFPLVRASRRLIESYFAGLEPEGWRGHFEIVLPSFAEAHGLSVGEIGANGPLTPPERRGLHYSTRLGVPKHEATFVFRPPRAYSYYETEPTAFVQPNRLYHPIKTDLPADEQRRVTRKLRWLAVRDWITGRRRGRIF